MASVFVQYRDELFATYEVELQFVDKIMGGVPKNPKVVEGWLRAKAGVTEARELFQATARTMAENGTPLDYDPSALATMNPDEMYHIIDRATQEHAALKSTNGFKHDDEGLYIEDRQIKAAIKESTNILYAGERWGKTKKGPKSFVAERVYVEGTNGHPNRLYLGTDEPDNVELVVGHVQDKQGKRSTLTYHEYVEKPVIQFRIASLRDEVSYDHWGMLFAHMELNGLGALRSQSHGRFEVTKFERVA
jgi:hypothetical protein